MNIRIGLVRALGQAATQDTHWPRIQPLIGSAHLRLYYHSELEGGIQIGLQVIAHKIDPCVGIPCVGIHHLQRRPDKVVSGVWPALAEASQPCAGLALRLYMKTPSCN